MAEEKLYTERDAKDQLLRWKDKHQAVFISEFDELNFVWRELTRSEYRKAMEYFDDDLDRAEYVCKLCVLDPTGVDYNEEIYAGIPESLAEQILRESGFAGDDSKIKYLTAEYEDEMRKFENQVSCVIAEVFPYFTFEEIENWSMEKTMRYFSRAKWILQTLRGVELTEEKPDQLAPPLQPPKG